MRKRWEFLMWLLFSRPTTEMKQELEEFRKNHGPYIKPGKTIMSA